ncbi:MAG: hypothetical protein AAFU80_19215 [Pseudomonadota bacterium]
MLALLVAVAACTGSQPNPVNGGRGDADDGDDGGAGNLPEVVIPADLAQDVSSVSLDDQGTADQSDDTLTVVGVALDGSPTEAVYTRQPVLDQPGYEAYSTQDDRLDRIFVAVSATSEDGSVRSTAVADGGQFNRYFRGVFYERLTPLTRPSETDAEGLVSYAGTYAGLTNLEAQENDVRIPLQPGDDPSTAPTQPRQTTGDVFLNVDFSSNQVNGSISNRQFSDGEDLPDLALINAELDAEGQFTGTPEFDGRPDLGGQGTYGGIIGGTDASSTAGGVFLDNIFLPDDPRDSNFDQEVGTFVLPRCGSGATTPATCSGLDDLD